MTRANERATPGGRLFSRLRLQLTLWYCGVLAGVLVLAGVALSLGLQQLLMRPVENEMSAQANNLRREWQQRGRCPLGLPPQNPLPPLQGNGPPVIYYRACVSMNGEVIFTQPGPDDLPGPFLDGVLVQTAIRTGRASDTIDGGPSVGALYRYAAVVGQPGRDPFGVLVLARSVEDQQAALTTQQSLLFGVGALTLIVAAGGGLWLANRALKPARLAFERQQSFVADASHELRTPITILRANAELLLRGRDKLPEDDSMLLDDIVTEAEHMARLAANMLALARLDAGQLQMEHDVVDLAQLAAEAVHRMAVLAGQRGVQVTSEAAAPVRTIGDQQLLERAALILLDNAIKYTPAGGSVSMSVGSAEKTVWLRVADTGTGIPREHLARLGERFYRVDKARSREAGGAGLGLAIARGIMAVHQGTLTINSEPGKGTTVTLTLPRRDGGSSH